MRLEHILNGHVEVAIPPPQIPVSGGERIVFDVQGGTVRGPGLDGVVLPVGGDWAFHRGDGLWRVDIRSVLKLDGGELVHVEAQGLVEINEATARALAGGGEIRFGDTYFVTGVRFDVDPGARPEVAVLGRRLGLTRGRFGPGWVEYQMFCVLDD